MISHFFTAPSSYFYERTPIIPQEADSVSWKSEIVLKPVAKKEELRFEIWDLRFESWDLRPRGFAAVGTPMTLADLQLCDRGGKFTVFQNARKISSLLEATAILDNSVIQDAYHRSKWRGGNVTGIRTCCHLKGVTSPAANPFPDIKRRRFLFVRRHMNWPPCQGHN